MNESLMLSFGVNPVDLSRLRGAEGRFTAAARNLPRHIQAQLAVIAEQFVRAVKIAFERHNRTGATIRSLSIRLEGFTVVVDMAGGAIYVQFGTGPHVIQSNSGKVLAFQGTDGGTVFRHSVNHPGYRGDPFFDRARDLVRLDLMLRQLATWTFADITGVATAMHNTPIYSAGEVYAGRAMGIGL